MTVARTVFSVVFGACCALRAATGHAQAPPASPAQVDAVVVAAQAARDTAAPQAPRPPADAPKAFRIGGRAHWDIARFDDDARGAGNPDASELRAAWVDVSGGVGGLRYKFEADLSADQVVAKDAYLAYVFARGTLTVGQFKQYVTLDDRISGNHTVMIERSYLAQALAPTYRWGIGWLGARDGRTLGVGAYSLESIDAWQTKGEGLAVRATWAPRAAQGAALHLGASAARERYDHPGARGAPALRVRTRPAGLYADASRTTAVDLPAGRDADVDKLVFELAGVRGAWSYQAELGGARYRAGAATARLRTGYAQAAWMITGQTRPYDAKQGRFGRIQPGARGALELGLRYDALLGRQTGVAPREVAVDAWTLGVNWYPRSHVRLMVDWTASRSRDRARARTLDRTDGALARLQLDF